MCVHPFIGNLRVGRIQILARESNHYSYGFRMLLTLHYYAYENESSVCHDNDDVYIVSSHRLPTSDPLAFSRVVGEFFYLFFLITLFLEGDTGGGPK